MLKTVFVIIGTIIGAGFASGQEIYSFFSIYEENGLIGIILSNVLIGIIMYVILKKTNQFNIKSYSELLEHTKVPKSIVNILNIIINIFLLISFYVMVAGFSAYFKQEFNISQIITIIPILILCYLTFMKNIEGIAKINSIIIPILIAIIIIIGAKANVLQNITNINVSNISFSANWIIKSIEYASYNSILLIPILISVSTYTKNKEKQTSIIVTCIMLVISLIISLLMFKQTEIYTTELPLVYIASSFGEFFKLIYGIVIVFAIYSTMISAGYGFLQNCSNNKKTYKILAIIMCASAIITLFFSFSGLVNLTYPVFGILGFLQLLLMKKSNKGDGAFVSFSKKVLKF